MDAGKLGTAQPLTLDELVVQHIERVLAERGGNISAAARALRMHRRTLQRKPARRKRGGSSAGASAS